MGDSYLDTKTIIFNMETSGDSKRSCKSLFYIVKIK